MNPSKFSLADVITLSAAIVFGFICFLGANFYTLGDTAQSIIFSLVITVLLGGTAYLAKFLKGTKGNFKTNFIIEIIVILIFTGLTIFFSISAFSHFFFVTSQKTVIQDKLAASITQVENMFAEYESYTAKRESLYESKLRGVVSNKKGNPTEYQRFGFSNIGVSDEQQINNKKFMLHADLFPSNYSDTIGKNGLKELAINWLLKAKESTVGWKPIGVVNIANEVEKNAQEWKDQLIGFSKGRQKGEEALDFSYDPTTSSDEVKKYFITLGTPSPLAIVSALAAYFLMLFSWYKSYRDSRTTGIFQTKDYEVVL